MVFSHKKQSICVILARSPSLSVRGCCCLVSCGHRSCMVSGVPCFVFQCRLLVFLSSPMRYIFAQPWLQYRRKDCGRGDRLCHDAPRPTPRCGGECKTGTRLGLLSFYILTGARCLGGGGGVARIAAAHVMRTYRAAFCILVFPGEVCSLPENAERACRQCDEARNDSGGLLLRLRLAGCGVEAMGAHCCVPRAPG